MTIDLDIICWLYYDPNNKEQKRITCYLELNLASPR
jgi:hypothetical protein